MLLRNIRLHRGVLGRDVRPLDSLRLLRARDRHCVDGARRDRRKVDGVRRDRRNVDGARRDRRNVDVIYHGIDFFNDG